MNQPTTPGLATQPHERQPESNAIQEYAPEEVYVCPASGYCASLDEEIRRQRWKTFRYIIYTALIAAFYTVMLLDVERNVLCDREDVICTEYENLDGTPKKGG